MSEASEREVPVHDAEEDVAGLGHPRGTLAIVIVYALLFALGWLALYIFGFLPRGAPQL